jgi:hypothetical protein
MQIHTAFFYCPTPIYISKCFWEWCVTGNMITIFNTVHHDRFFKHISEIGSNSETCLKESKTMENGQSNSIVYFLCLCAICNVLTSVCFVKWTYKVI